MPLELRKLLQSESELDLISELPALSCSSMEPSIQVPAAVKGSSFSEA